MRLAAFLFIFLIAGLAQAQNDCVCPAQVRGLQTHLVAAPDGQTGVQIAVNTTDGSYFIGWSTVQALPDNKEPVSIEGQIFDRNLNPISEKITFVNNPDHISGDAVWLGGAAFNPLTQEYFVVTANVLVDGSGKKFGVLRSNLVSSSGILTGSNIGLADTKHRPGSFFAPGGIDVQFNTESREYLVKYTTFLQGQPKTALQRFSETGSKIGEKTIFLKAGDMRFNSHAKLYLFVYSHIVYNNYEIKSQILSSELKRIGTENTILSVPYDFGGPISHTGPFPVYNASRRKFVVFWYQGPWNDSVIYERSIESDGALSNVVSTGIHRQIDVIRFNPVTQGYILIPNASKVTRISSNYKITSEFSISCQRPPVGFPTLVFNRFIPEFLLVWFYPIRYGANNDLYARQIAASIPSGACN